MTAVAPLFHGEQVIGRVETVDESTFIPVSEESQILIIRLDKQTGLIKELMKEELISFDIVNIPAVRS